jgi:hypothetical protein
VLYKDGATVALVAKLSLAIDGTTLEPVWAYQGVDIFATLDGAIGPNISVDVDLLGNLSAQVMAQADFVTEAREVLTSIDYAAVVLWIASGQSGGCSKQGCKSESSFHC